MGHAEEEDQEVDGVMIWLIVVRSGMLWRGTSLVKFMGLAETQLNNLTH